MYRYELLIWKRFVSEELPFTFNDLDQTTPETMFQSIMDQYSDFEEEMYELAASHDPSVGQDNWREVELIKQVRGQDVVLDDDPLVEMFVSILDQYSDFQEKMYELADSHDPSVGQDHWREVELINQVRGDVVLDDDPLVEMFKGIAESFKPKPWEKAS